MAKETLVKIFVGMLTYVRADLLIRNKKFLESIEDPDFAMILDNGNQDINIKCCVYRPGVNVGITKAWNFFMKAAFETGSYDALVILQDDIVWDMKKLEIARRILVERDDVDFLLSPHLFSVQVQRRRNLEGIGLYDERFSPALCEDDDYALTMTSKGKVYERFVELDPLPGSIINGTPKTVPWGDQKKKLIAKWGFDFGVNSPDGRSYQTNKGLTIADLRSKK